MPLILKKLTLLVCSLGAFAIGCEVAIRLLSGKPKTPTMLTSFFGYEPTTGWAGCPNVTRRVVTADFDAQISHDADGMRNCGLAWRIGDDSRRASEVVWCLGDSQTWGWGVDNDKTFVAILNERQQPRRVFRNLGIPGFGQVQEWLLLKRCFQAYPLPHRVLIYFTAQNDFSDNVSSEYSLYRPCFHVIDGQPELFNYPAPVFVPWQIRRWMQENSLLYNHLHFYVHRAKSALANREQDQGGIAAFQRDMINCPSASAQEVVALREAVRRLASLCREYHVNLMVASERAGPGISQLQAICRDCSIPYLDLSRRWRQHFAAPKPAPVCFRYDAHYNETGHRLLADAIEAEIAERPTCRR